MPDSLTVDALNTQLRAISGPQEFWEFHTLLEGTPYVLRSRRDGRRVFDFNTLEHTVRYHYEFCCGRMASGGCRYDSLGYVMEVTDPSKEKA